MGAAKINIAPETAAKAAKTSQSSQKAPPSGENAGNGGAVGSPLLTAPRLRGPRPPPDLTGSLASTRNDYTTW